jgi:putative heme transporter
MGHVLRHSGTPQHAPQVRWATLAKILLAVAGVYLWFLLWHVVLLVIVVLIVAVALAPAVNTLQRWRWPRWVAAATVMLLVACALAGFSALTFTSLTTQAQELAGRTGAFEQQLREWLPAFLVGPVERSIEGAVSAAGTYIMQSGGLILYAIAAFVLGFILVLYLLIEGEDVYQWVRAFWPEKHRGRFDRTALAAREAASAYVLGNVVTSICAAVYISVVLSALGVPAALLLGLIAFVCDFIPVLGSLIACAPAMIMAASVSPAISLLMIPVYLFYDFLENYFIGPYVYGTRLRLSNVAVLLAFTVGAELAGILGALIALPLAAIYPAVERVWLGRHFGEEVVDEHVRLARKAEANR